MSRSPEEMAAIGRELVEYRRLGVAWKLLERQYGLGRTWLWTLYQQALAEHGGEERCSLNIAQVVELAATPRE